MGPENVAGLFMMVVLASIVAIALAFTDACAFGDKPQAEKVESSYDKGNLPVALMKVVAQLHQDQVASNARFEQEQAASNARFEKAMSVTMSIIQAMERQGEKCECMLGHCHGLYGLNQPVQKSPWS